jgi:4-amino-4-deoxy-L-arabinose transferase-like glycosyltransferase
MRLTCLAACTVFIFTLLLSVWHNDFPARYHPDEPDKVAQVLSGERNFHHPPLMLDAAVAVLRLVSGDQLATPENAVRVGRWLSAFYIAAACAVFTVIAGLYEGPLAALFAGCLLASNTDAVLAGHFFKEDPLFALGLSLTLLAGAYRWKNRPGRFSLVALGAAAGFAAATKYLGVLALIYAIALEVMLAHQTKPASRLPWRLLVIVLTAFAVVFLLCISSWWGRFPAMWRALFEASQTAYLGNYAIGAQVPHLRFVGMFFIEPPLALLGFVLYWWAWSRRKRSIFQYTDHWLLLCAPLILVLVFSFSTITAVRYFLPISLLVACVGGCGLAIGIKIVRDWAYRKWRFSPGATTCVAIAICAVAQLPALGSLEKGFASDDRRALRAYIATELPASAVIAADDLADLKAAPPLPQRVLAQNVVADLGNLAELRARGITHVVVCWYDSRRYVNPSKHPAAGLESEFFRRREFYLDLGNRARVLWHSDIVQPFPLRPGLSLYELPPAAVPGP